MQKFVILILILGLTASCKDNGEGSGGKRRQTPVDAPTPTPIATPASYGGSLYLVPGEVTASAAGMAMKVSIAGGNNNVITSASGVAADITIGAPSSSR